MGIIGKSFTVLVALSVMAYTLPRQAQADEGKKKWTPQEESEYAQLEKSAPELQEFTGGGAAEVLLVLVILAGIAFLIYWFIIKPDMERKAKDEKKAESPKKEEKAEAVVRAGD